MKAKILSNALANVRAAAKYYDNEMPGLGDEFKAFFKQTQIKNKTQPSPET